MKKLALVVILTFGSLITSAQIETLERGEFFRIVNEASDSTFSVPHRSVSTNRLFVDGVPKIDWIQTREFLDRRTRRLVQKKEDGVIEVISVGGKNYQREDDGVWREVVTPENVYLFRTSDIDIVSKYYAESVTRNGVKYNVLTWHITEKSGRFSENKTYIGSDGKKFREESHGGTLSPKTVIWDEVIEYTYDIGRIKIEAPIK